MVVRWLMTTGGALIRRCVSESITKWDGEVIWMVECRSGGHAPHVIEGLRPCMYECAAKDEC